MREITEEEAFALAGEEECPVLRKEESDPLEAAVCLKRFPTGFVLGASDKVKELCLYFTTDLAEAEQQYEELVTQMRASGTPFGTV
jgi:hypothetical protein